MQINLENLSEMISKFDPEEVYDVEIKSIIDAGINPREVDVKYAEQIPQSAPPILLGVIENDDELKDLLIIIDGNHRLYSYINIHDQKYIPAKIKRYKERGAAIVDAYKCNISHGKRLTDKEVAEGIKKTIQFLKGENNERTYKELTAMLNISKSGFYEYVTWDKVNKILKTDIDKIKANKLNIFLRDPVHGEDNLKLFWELNKNLNTLNIKNAIKHYKETGEIVDYEKYKVQQALLTDDEDDGLEEKITSIQKPEDFKNDNEEFTLDDTEEETDVEDYDELEKVSYEDNDEDEDENDIEEKPDNYYTGGFVANNEPIEEGRKIEVSKLKDPKNDDHLVSVPGLVRKYSFETVMNNVFEELREGVITSFNSLNEVLDKHLHDNRQMFESKKDEYLRSIDNIEIIISKIRKKIEKANKDLKQ